MVYALCVDRLMVLGIVESILVLVAPPTSVSELSRILSAVTGAVFILWSLWLRGVGRVQREPRGPQ